MRQWHICGINTLTFMQKSNTSFFGHLKADAQTKQVGGLLRKYRRLNGISTRMVAKACGISMDTVSRFERGETDTGFDTVCKIADFLGFEVILAARLVDADPEDEY